MNSIETVFSFLQEKWYVVIAVIAIVIWNFVSREVDKETKSRKCEHCLSIIDLKARTCKNCGKDQEIQNPKSLSEENLERATSYDLKSAWSMKKNMIPFLVILLVVVIFIVL